MDCQVYMDQENMLEKKFHDTYDVVASWLDG